jgi:hypothetical protein
MKTYQSATSDKIQALLVPHLAVAIFALDSVLD